MNIDQARGLLNEIEVLLYSSSDIQRFFRNVFNEIPTRVVDERFVEALAKFNALGALDADLNNFIDKFIRSQIQRFYNQLYRTRRWHLIHVHVYTYSDVLDFVRESQKLIQLLREKIERIHAESCRVSEEFSKQIPKKFILSGSGVLIRED